MHEVLINSGLFIFSVPNGSLDRYANNHYHKNFFTLSGLKRLLSGKFKILEVYYQYPVGFNMRVFFQYLLSFYRGVIKKILKNHNSPQIIRDGDKTKVVMNYSSIGLFLRNFLWSRSKLKKGDTVISRVFMPLFSNYIVICKKCEGYN